MALSSSHAAASQVPPASGQKHPLSYNHDASTVYDDNDSVNGANDDKAVLLPSIGWDAEAQREGPRGGLYLSPGCDLIYRDGVIMGLQSDFDTLDKLSAYNYRRQSR